MDPGTLLAGRYRIEAPLASGGMGIVYSATQLPLGRSVAVKVLKRELLKQGPFLARLRREAHTAAALKHPNIVEVTDLVLEEELAFLVMELLEGESLGSLIGRATKLSAVAVASIGRQVLCALDAAHAAGLVHRDVKPDNIFLVRAESGDDTVKLLDFGLVKVDDASDLSKLTATNAILGTWQYMAPEQARGEEADARADVYALGAVLYYALTKKRPYQAAEMQASMFALSSCRAPPLRSLRPDVPPQLAATIEKALEKDLLRRWQSARDMLDALLLVDDDEGLPDTAPSLAGEHVAGPAIVETESETVRVSVSSRVEGDSETMRVSVSSRIDTTRAAAETAENPPLTLDPAGREAYESTLDLLPTVAIELSSSDLASEIESLELQAIPPSREKWNPPQKARRAPLEDWSVDDAFRKRAAKRKRLRRIGLFAVASLLVFAAGLFLGELLFR